MKKLLITLLLGITCTTISLPAIGSAAICFNAPTNASTIKDSFKDRSSVHIEDLQDEISMLTSAGISDVDFLNYEIKLLRTSIYLSALIQSYINDEQLIDFAEEIIEENSGVIRESRILIDKLDVNDKKNATASDDYLKSAKAITDTMFKNLNSINYTENDSLIYINEIMYLISTTKDLASLIAKSSKNTTIKTIADDIINNADNNLETIKEIKPAFN